MSGKEVRARLHLSDEMQAYLSERAAHHHRSVNDEMVSILEESQKMVSQNRPCVIAMGIEPGSSQERLEMEQKSLEKIFQHVFKDHGGKNGWEFICVSPRDMSYDEAFIVLNRRFPGRSGWVYADTVFGEK